MMLARKWIFLLWSVLIMAGAPSSRPPSMSLLDQATKVMSMADRPYPLWLSDHELLVARLTHGFSTLWVVTRRDIRTERKTPLPGLSRILSPYTMRLSPDRRRLLWSERVPTDSENLKFKIVTANLDGSHLHKWPQHHTN